MFILDIDGSVSGPLTDGRALRAHDEYVQDVAKVVARRGERIVVSLLKGSIKHPSPHYWNTIHIEPTGASGWTVTDRNSVYGPWLEGTGSRNRARPGFPGYHSFRKAGEMLDGLAGNIAEDNLRLYIPRMN
ncbi:MAG: hypothetical protein V4515_14410 [Chloroflexota bacterium]